jgi:hypothetical protein
MIGHRGMQHADNRDGEDEQQSRSPYDIGKHGCLKGIWTAP